MMPGHRKGIPEGPPPMPEPSLPDAAPLPPATLSCGERLALRRADQAQRWARGEGIGTPPASPPEADHE
jgi:hypothetical protein